MKKLIISIAVASAASLPAAAKVVTPGEADAVAREFFSVSSGTTVPTLSKAPSRKGYARERQPYYIYNSTDAGGGFVIVSGDDSFGSILAYSRSGTVDLSSMPESMQGLLDMYAEAYTALENNPGPSAMADEASLPAVAPLLGDIAWGQDAPFNTLCPVSAGSAHYYVGCVATAATQIMRYHGYPERGIGSKTYTDPKCGKTLSADFGNTVYDWAAMPAKVPRLPSAAQTAAYSTLAAHFGVAVEMQYETSGSGTYDFMVPDALRRYFGYDSGARFMLRSYYSTSEWMQMISAELADGRPVFYGGTSDKGTGGHAFVIDGIDTDGFVHVNWGWYGNSNGYFRINHLDPESLGEGGGAGGYNLNQDMVIGIQPAVSGSERDYAIYAMSRCSADGPFSGNFMMMTYVSSYESEPVSIQLEGALVKDGKVVAALGGDNITLPGYSNGSTSAKLVTLKSVSASAQGVADGEYSLCFVYKTPDCNEWKVLRHSRGHAAYAEAYVYQGQVSILDKHVPAPDGVLRTDITVDGTLYAGGYCGTSFTLENRSADFDISKITFRLTSVDNPAVSFDSEIDCMVYNQSVETVSLNFPVSSSITPGEYILTALVKNANGEYPFDASNVNPTHVRVLAEPSAPVLRLVGQPSWQVNNETAAVADRITQGETLYITASFRNAGVAGSAKALARLVNTATGASSPFVQTDVTFSGAETQKVIFGRALPHDPGTYRVEFSQVGDDFSEAPIMQHEQPVEITVYPSDDLMAEVVSFDFPAKIARGESVASKLVLRGLTNASTTIYIRVRQLTAKNGELVNMSSAKLTAGEELTLSRNYRPSSTLDDGIYMVMIESKSGSSYLPLGNHAAYARTVAIGDVTSVEKIEACSNAAAIWCENGLIRAVAANGLAIESLRIYNITGMTSAVIEPAEAASAAEIPASCFTPGVYLATAMLSNGSAVTAKLIIR